MENKKIEQMMEEIRIREIQERELIEKNHKIEMQRGAESIRYTALVFHLLCV